MLFEPALTRSHCVAAGKGMPIPACSVSIRWNGSPVPYFNKATMLVAVASYFSSPTPSGAGAVYTSPHRLQRSPSQAYTVAIKGAMPVILTSLDGSLWGYSFPLVQPGQLCAVCNDGCRTDTRRAPV
jgi:hypothetical protein